MKRMLDMAKTFTAQEPQYLLLNRAPNQNWDQNRPESVTDALFQEVRSGIGEAASPSGARRVGLSFILSYLNGPPEKMAETLRRLLDLSLRHETPVLVVLDGVNWWGYRSDLWNWWEPGSPGYAPENVENVEWAGWRREDALKIAWRNWGRQIRVQPPPNLASRRFREANERELFRLARLLKEWADALPPQKRWLFPGVKIGWEVSVGINAYYYPNGNHYREKYPNDPGQDPPFAVDRNKGFTGGLVPLGHAALTTKGWKKSGAITLADHERLCADYIGFIASVCRRAGLGRREVFVHAGGQYAPWERHYSHRIARTPNATPGWSLYNTPPDQAGDLPAAVRSAPDREWCAAEWLTFAPNADGWAEALERTLNFGRCRLLSLYNWEGVRENPAAREGLRRALGDLTSDRRPAA